MALFGRDVPLKKLWTFSLLSSSVVHFTLLVLSTMSGSPVLFLLSLFVTVLSFLVLIDWRFITLILNSVGQAFSMVSLLCVYSSKSLNCSLKDKWQSEALKWLFPIFSLDSVCVSLTIIGLKLKYKVRDEYPLRDILTLLKDCDSYFSEHKRLREKKLEAKKLENELRKMEIQREEEVAKKIVDGLYGFTNRPNIPGLEPNADDAGENDQSQEVPPLSTSLTSEQRPGLVSRMGTGTKVIKHQDGDYNFHISIPDDLKSVESNRDKNTPYIHWDSSETFNEGGN